MTESERAHWEGTLARWRARLHDWGLDDLAATLLDAAAPFSLIGAQALYVAQPALSVFFRRDDVGGLAHLLEDPARFAWMRAQLVGLDDADRSDEDEVS